MLFTGLPSIDVEALRSRLFGEVYGPDDEGWDEARRAWNLAVDQRPAAVALPITDADVVEVVNFAREQGLRVAPQSDRPRRLRDRDRSRTRSCSRPSTCAACGSTRRPGAPASAPARIWQDVTAPASAYGLAPLAGSAHDVGVVGYTLGGGLSWLARAARLRLRQRHRDRARDRRRRASSAPTRTTTPSCSAALRGGGGNFGVVTAMEFELYPVEQLTAARCCGRRARRGGLQRLARVGARPCRTGHLAVPAAQRPAAAGRAGAAARPQLRRDRGRDPRRRRRSSPRCARSRPSSTWSARSRPRADRDPQRPEAADARPRRPPRPRRRAAGGDRRPRATPPAPSWSPSSCATSAATCPSTASACSRSASRWTPSPRWPSTPPWPA